MVPTGITSQNRSVPSRQKHEKKGLGSIAQPGASRHEWRMTHGWLQRAMPLIVIAWAFLVGCSEQGSPGDAFLGKGRAALSTSELKTYWVVMRERANLSMAQSFPRWDQRGQFVYSQLRTTAGASQEGLRQWLAQRGLQHETFWIVNTIQVEADAASISEISRRPDVARVVEGSMFSIPPLQPGADIKPDAPDWGGEAIRAPEVWEQFGARGEGITVATIDTGVDFLHPALENKYRGKVGEGEFEHDYNFFDPSGFCGVEPCDSDLHGTHVTGTMVGDDEVDAQIGIAPDAQWIAAVGCPFGGCPPDVLLSAGEWILAPTDSSGNDPRPELRPHVVNNSWGGPGGDEFYREIVQSWVSAGIFPVFSAGNEGLFGCSSSGSPGDYPESYSVAAFDEFGFIADFSSRGPTGVEGVAKPDIAAPGVDVLSSVPGGGYELLSGTSMAAPHVAGTVALMWSAAPSLVGDVNGTREILGLSAINVDDTSCGGDAEHNGVWGEGKLDAFAAVDQSPRGPTGTISGDLVSITGQPIAEARVTAEGEETSRTARSDAQGDFAFRLPVGSYEVNARAFGFEAPSPLQAQVNEGETTRIRFRLQPAPTSTLSGRVLDEAGEPLGGATVRVLDTPLDPVVSDESGFFTFGEIPRGTYQIRVDAGRCFVQPLVEVELLGDQELSVEVAQRIDEFGYSCRPAPFQYVEATEPVSLFGFEDAVAVELPFPFAFYGQTYEEVTVTSSGFLSFEQLSFGSSFNSAIPDPALPNAAIYAFWDELTVEPGFAGQVFTATLGEAPNRRFVVEWREVLEFFEFLPVSFEIVLHENGQIELLYNTTGNGNRQLGGSATVGLEDERGELAFQYSLNEPILEQGTAILFSQPPSGFVEGQVVDSSDGLPLEGATVRASAPDFRSRSATTNSQGLYRLQLPVGEFELEVTKEHYSVATVSLSVQEGDLLQHDFVLDTAALQLSSRSLQLTVPVDESRSRALVLSNAGALDLQFEVAESGGRRASPLVSRWLSAPVDVDVRSNDTRALFAGGLARPEPRGVLDTGDILEEFTPNEFVDGLVQVENHLWLSAFDCTPVTCGMIAREYTLSGERTGREWLIGGGNMEAYGMAYDEARGLICQVALRFDSFGTGIECWDPDTGNIEVSIPGSQSWGGSLLRALAYNASDDTFFVSDVGDPVFHVAGASWAEPGEQLGSCAPADRLVSGLAYNDSAEVLWAATNSPEDTLYQLNPSDCSVLGMLEHPGSGSFKGGRLDMNSDGNLWMVNQSRGSVLLVDSGLPVEADVPWLSVNPSTGFVSPGGAVALTIDIHTAGLEPGLYLANLVVRSNSGREPRIRIPVSLLVPAYRQAVNVGGDTYFDALGDAWEADQSFDASGDWGYFEPGTPVRTLRPIANTDDDPLFQAVRMAPYAYRFESIPNGVYEVELGFAEIIKRTGPGDRLFDVIVEQELVLPAYDIAFEVGTYRADRHSFFTEVTDGRLDLRLVGRSEQAPPLISAVRVTHRPDR